MARKPAQISVIQFGGGHASALRVRPTSSGLEVTQYAVESWALDLEPHALGAAMRRFAERAGIAGDRIVAVVPRHEVSVRTLVLPSHSPDEIEGMVGLRAEEILPYPVEQLLSAQCILRKLENGDSSVLAAVARKDLIQERLDILVRAGLEPESMYLSTSSLLSAIAPIEGGDDRSCAVLEIGAGGAELVVAKSGDVAFGRGIALDVGTEAEGFLNETTLAEVARETGGMLASFARSSSESFSIREIHVSTAFSDALTVCGRLSEDVDVRFESASGLLNTKVRYEGDISDLPVSSLGAALCAEGRGAYALDLLPPSYRRKRARAEVRARAKRLAAVAAICLVAAAGVFAQAVYQRMAYIAELDERAELLRPYAERVRAKRDHLRRIEQQVERSDGALEMLSVISELAPAEGLNITRFRFERDTGITLQGRARAPRYFDVLLDDIRTVGSVSVPQLLRAHEVYRTLGRERGQEVWDFSISIPFASEDTD